MTTTKNKKLHNDAQAEKILSLVQRGYIGETDGFLMALGYNTFMEFAEAEGLHYEVIAALALYYADEIKDNADKFVFPIHRAYTDMVHEIQNKVTGVE